VTIVSKIDTHTLTPGRTADLESFFGNLFLGNCKEISYQQKKAIGWHSLSLSPLFSQESKLNFRVGSRRAVSDCECNFMNAGYLCLVFVRSFVLLVLVYSHMILRLNLR
jgi:hypothetical protein